MRVLVILSIAFMANTSFASEKVVMSNPLKKGDCVAAFPINGVVQYKSIKQTDAEKLDQKTSSDTSGNECSEKLKSSLSIEKSSDCRVLCNVSK